MLFDSITQISIMQQFPTPTWTSPPVPLQFSCLQALSWGVEMTFKVEGLHTFQPLKASNFEISKLTWKNLEI